jgi:hypothetical protein
MTTFFQLEKPISLLRLEVQQPSEIEKIMLKTEYHLSYFIPEDPHVVRGPDPPHILGGT